MREGSVYIPPLAAAAEIVAGLRSEGWPGDELTLIAGYGVYVSSGLVAFERLLAEVAA